MTRTTTCTKSQAIMQKTEGLLPPRNNRHPRRKVKRAVSEIRKKIITKRITGKNKELILKSPRGR